MDTHSILDSRFPVLVPFTEELKCTDQQFAQYLRTIKAQKVYKIPACKSADPTAKSGGDQVDTSRPTSRLVDALSRSPLANQDNYTLAQDDKVFTENHDVAHASTGSPLVNAFYDLKDSADDVEKLLNEAWAENPAATLKIIFNARSIHLGKGDKTGAYKSLGWLYQYHPQTLLANLIWLARPVIDKKVQKDDDKTRGGQPDGSAAGKATTAKEDDDFEMIEEAESTEAKDEGSATFLLSAADAPLGANTTQNDVKYGVAHGYWKDLANLLLLAVNDQLKPDANADKVLKVDTRKIKKKDMEWDPEKAKTTRRDKQFDRYNRFLAKFGDEHENKAQPEENFKGMHLTVARLFASQLRADIAALNSKGKRGISMAAKWCPSPGEAHDKQTFIVSSIAEALFSFDEVCPVGTDPADRVAYLKHARLALRTRILSPLRKHLAIVERNITDGTFKQIKYELLPSLAMSRYSGLFLKKDEEHFEAYLEQVSQGKLRISGAVLMPSTLVEKARQGGAYDDIAYRHKPAKSINLLAEKRLLNGQWKTLVQRIKDSGKIESAMAVCDVSGSMTYPHQQDGTCPMDSAIGLSLLLAEVVEPPFGGHFITFSESPIVQKVGGASDTRSFQEKVNYIMQSPWGMNTNFESVFTDLLLPIAVNNKIKPEEMVKQIFVFSDMQFDAAQTPGERWSTSYERIRKRFTEAGYQMPELVFWNLASGSRGAPVKADEPGVSLVSGYSQGMLKVFLDGGLFEDEIEEEIVTEEKDNEDSGGDEAGAVNVHVEKKVKKDPLAAVKKAISHPAYAMLNVVD